MGGGYKAYPEYRASGADWLGDVPGHWNGSSLKYVTKIKYGIGEPPKYRETGVPLIRATNIWSGNISNENLVFVNPDDISVSRILWLEEGDIIVVRSGAGTGDSAIIPKEYEGSIAGFDMVVTPVDCFPNFLGYALLSTYIRYGQLDLHKSRAAQPHLNAEDLGACLFLSPPMVEQVAIANFLDHETAKIDTLIEKQQQLIKLLKEKRQAVISHAVTKGLDPKAPMKDSGVDWLEEVPEGWDVKRIGLLFLESSARASSEVELKYPILSVSIHHGISDKELNEDELDRKVTRSEDRSLYKVVENNDLAYNMMRAWQGGFGASTLSGLVSPAYVVCKPQTSMDSYYFELVLRTANAVTELKKYSRGITDFRLRLYWDEFKNIRVPVPPSNEINEILNSIRVTNSKYDNLILVAERQIELLKERRTALISAAVTGKIDVRNWTSPKQTKAYKEKAA